MTNALLIAQREYLENVKTRGFWLSILLMPVLVALLTTVSLLLSESSAPVQYTVVDNSSWVLEAVQKKLLRSDVQTVLESSILPSAKTEADQATLTLLQQVRMQTSGPDSQKSDTDLFVDDVIQLLYTLNREHASITDAPTLLEQFVAWWQEHPDQVLEIVPNASFARYKYLELANPSVQQLNELIKKEQLLGYFLIPEDPMSSTEGAVYVTKNLTNRDLQMWFAGVVTTVVQTQRIREESIAPQVARWIQQTVNFDTQVISETGSLESAEVGDTLQQWVPVVFVYLLWISIFAITQMLLTNTIEEKSNKLIEVLLSSVSARELMAGKILGIAATGLTIVACWLSAVLVLILALPVLLGAPLPLDLASLVSNPFYLASFTVYFVLGYLFYAALLCGVGSLCDTLKEAQNLIMPVQLILFIPLLVMIPIGKDPNGTLAIVMSWIPPFTPFAMMNRAAFPPGPLTYLFTTLLMLVSIYAALRLAGRIFERGILMTGKAPKLTQLLRFIRHGDTPHN